MATRRNPRFKECRRLGVNVCGHPKALDRAGAPAFKKTKKASDYSLHLTEKQKVKAYYGILEKQLRRYFDQASYAVKVGSTISLVEKVRSSEQFKKTFLAYNKSNIPYLERDEASFSGKLISLPLRKDIPVEINDQMVVEYYSK